MSLTLRRIVWSDGTSQPDDYEVRYEGRTVGRIYRLGSVSRHKLSGIVTAIAFPRKQQYFYLTF